MFRKINDSLLLNRYKDFDSEQIKELDQKTQNSIAQIALITLRKCKTWLDNPFPEECLINKKTSTKNEFHETLNAPEAKAQENYFDTIHADLKGNALILFKSGISDEELLKKPEIQAIFNHSESRLNLCICGIRNKNYHGKSAAEFWNDTYETLIKYWQKKDKDQPKPASIVHTEEQMSYKKF